jgi:hypothetical protein
MKKITVILDNETAARARAQAAAFNMNLSRYIGEALRNELRATDDHEALYRAWRKRKPFPLQGSPEPYPNREELYDRPIFRRR